jgi:hypothetical protein
MRIMPALGVLFASGCASSRIASIEAHVNSLAREVSVIRTGNIGGGGDSVTAWLYAAIAAAAIFYPVVVRPIRRAINGRRKDDRRTMS